MYSSICSTRIMSYALLNIYILIVGGLIRTKNVKVTVICNLILSILVTVGARVMWFVLEEEKSFAKLFMLNFSGLKISGVLLGGIAAIFLFRKMFPQYKKEMTNTIIEAMFLGAAMTKIECFGIGCCQRIRFTRYMDWNIFENWNR